MDFFAAKAKLVEKGIRPVHDITIPEFYYGTPPETFPNRSSRDQSFIFSVPPVPSACDFNNVKQRIDFEKYL